jgi:hypothetical protein
MIAAKSTVDTLSEVSRKEWADRVGAAGTVDALLVSADMKVDDETMTQDRDEPRFHQVSNQSPITKRTNESAKAVGGTIRVRCFETYEACEKYCMEDFCGGDARRWALPCMREPA